MINHKANKSGFTLVEMAIVLVIIAIVVGAILKGRELYTNTKLNSIVTKLKEYEGAYTQFKEKYSFAPGDYPGAGDTFSASGNGDGGGFTDSFADGNWPEQFLSWQVLALGGFIPGNYIGWSATDDGTIDAGRDIPAAPFGNAGYSIFRYTNPDFGYGPWGNVDAIIVGGVASATDATGGILTPKQAYFVDSKMDDVSPTGGQIYSYTGANNFSTSYDQCILDQGSLPNNLYPLTQENPTCFIIYFMEPPYLNN